MSISQDQLRGSKLKGKSSDKLAFTTNGQNETNSEPTKIVTNYNSKTLSDASFDNSKTTYINTESADKPTGKANNVASFNYSISHPKNTNNYRINWNWKSLYNTPGNITGKFIPYLSGAGSTEDLRASAEGVDSIQFLINPALKYNHTTKNVTDVGTNVTVTMNFPKNVNYDNNIIEDGGSITFTTYSTNNVSLPNNASTDIQKKYNGIGLVSYNTPNPILNINVKSGDTDIARIINDKGEETAILKYSDAKFSGATRIKLLPNLPKGGKGTVKGKMAIDTSLSTSTSSGQSGKVTCTNEGKKFDIEEPNQNDGIAKPRQTTISFTYNSETNNVNGIANADLAKKFTIYQAGKKIELPNPEITYSWSSNDNYFSTFNPDKNSVSFKWANNSGTKARVYNLNNKKITFKNNPEDQEDNTGGEQILELVNFDYDNKIETTARSTYIYCKMACENCLEGPQAQISSQYIEAIVNGKNKWYENISNVPNTATITGVVSGIKVSQQGQTWPDPEITVKIVAKPHPTNPSNVTNDETKKPVCWICQEDETPTSNVGLISISKTKQNKVKLYFNDIRPTSVGASNTGTVSATDSLSFGIDGGTKDITVNGSNITFNDSYTPAMGECKWDIIIESADTISNVNGTCSVDTVAKTITVPGNKTIAGQSSPVKISGNLTGNTNYSSNAAEVALTKKSKSGTFTISIGPNKGSASFAKVSDINAANSKVTANITTDIVSTSERKATLTLTSDTANVKFGGTSLTKAISLTQNKDTVTGTLSFKATKKSGGNATFTPSTSVNYATNTSVNIGTFSADGGSVVYIPTVRDVTIPPEGVTDKEITPTNKPSIAGGSDTIFTLSGTISCDKVAEGTAILFGNKTTTDITISAGAGVEDKNDYYEWTFNAAQGLPNETVTIPNTKGRTIKLSCVANPNKSGAGATDPTEGWDIVDQASYGEKVENNLNFYHVTAGYGGAQQGRSLGTIKVKYTLTGETSAAANVYQNGSDAGAKPITRTFTIVGRNCTVTADNSASSNTNGSTIYAKISNIKRITTDFYRGYLNNLSESAIKYYPKYSSNNSNYNIGAFDKAVNVSIGCTISSAYHFNITLPCYVDITCNNNKETRRILMDDVKITDMPLQDNCVEYTFVWSIPGNDNYETPNNTITVTTTPNTPGNRTYTLKTVKITITNPNAVNENKIVDSVDLNYKWTFNVDSKHYYNG